MKVVPFVRQVMNLAAVVDSPSGKQTTSMFHSIGMPRFIEQCVSISLILFAFREAFSPTDAHAENERPNIVFTMSDDQGPWALSVTGDANVQTPHLD